MWSYRLSSPRRGCRVSRPACCKGDCVALPEGPVLRVNPHPRTMWRKWQPAVCIEEGIRDAGRFGQRRPGDRCLPWPECCSLRSHPPRHAPFSTDQVSRAARRRSRASRHSTRNTILTARPATVRVVRRICRSTSNCSPPLRTQILLGTRHRSGSCHGQFPLSIGASKVRIARRDYIKRIAADIFICPRFDCAFRSRTRALSTR